MIQREVTQSSSFYIGSLIQPGFDQSWLVSFYASYVLDLRY